MINPLDFSLSIVDMHSLQASQTKNATLGGTLAFHICLIGKFGIKTWTLLVKKYTLRNYVGFMLIDRVNDLQLDDKVQTASEVLFLGLIDLTTAL